ncbi:unnamed protein product [Mucor hiemalis]
MESADIKTTVTPETSIPEIVEQQEKSPIVPADDLNITSEQLLFALTSVPPSESTTSGTKEESSTNATKHISTSAEAMDVDSNEQEKSVIVKELLQPITPAQHMTEETASHSTTPPFTTINITPPVTTNPAPTGLGITPNKSTPPPTTTPSISLPSQSTTQPSKTNNNNNSSPALTNALSNLPDISAALRRLSSHSVPASVIEQLSSSPRIPNIINERRTSSSPSEILGNALAAVAANAAAASRSSPKQPQPQTNTATAIGNLAAITANISNLLHSGGFHRNSFSQEDTQKLAAAVAVARNGQQQQQQPSHQPQQQRRKSSMATVGNTFSNMIEMMGRNNSNTNHNTKPSTPIAAPVTPAPVKPKLIIKNEQVWKSLEGVEEKRLGFQLYTPQLVLPNLEANLNGIMEIRVPARYLTFENVRVKKRAVWGTDIYTDDSDIVAMAIHSGKFEPVFVEPEVDAEDPFALAIAGKKRESLEAAKKLALSGKKWVCHDNLIPDYDLQITVRVLPTLQHYTSCTRHRIKSREWAKHDGMSLFVNKVEKIKRGEARLRGRSTIKSNMFAYEKYRREALGLTSSSHPKSRDVNETKLSTQPTRYPNCRVKKTPRVMRMFQIRSEMTTSNKDIEE